MPEKISVQGQRISETTALSRFFLKINKIQEILQDTRKYGKCIEQINAIEEQVKILQKQLMAEMEKTTKEIVEKTESSTEG
jgi:oligoribonuclease NrnB/cAMP/cGMP phosphodiesterase (DHH superfamily)